MFETVTVLDTPCVLADQRTLLQSLSEACQTRQRPALSVDFTNVHIVAMRTVDSGFARNTANVDWFVPDSQVLSWAMTLLGARGHSRVYGPHFLDYFVRHASPELTHYFLGASQECLERLLANLRNIRPDLRIAGSHNGYFSEQGEERILSEINSKRPDLLWVGLGTPKQQAWINRHKHQLDAGAILAVGFAFDVNARAKPDAPGWMGPLGLIWLHRLATEPRRLWRRYLYFNSVFMAKLLWQLLRTRPAQRSSRPESAFKVV